MQFERMLMLLLELTTSVFRLVSWLSEVVFLWGNFQRMHIIAWRRSVAVERRIRDREVAGSSLGRALRRKNSGQVSHTYG